MKTGGGDFSSEAYDQLREAYSKEQAQARSVEERGHDIMGLNLGLETAPVDSPWADKIPKWSYPDGKSQYLDQHQDPAEILQIMRDSAQERVDAKAEEEEEEESVSDEELKAVLDDLVDEEEAEESDDAEDESEEEEKEDEEESDDEDVEEEKEEEEEAEVEEEEEAEEEVEEAEEELDPEAIASQIAELRSELESMQFVTDTPDDESE